LILAQRDAIEQLRAQLTALATELASLGERICHSSRNSTKPAYCAPSPRLNPSEI